MISAVRKIASTFALRSTRNQPSIPITAIATKTHVYHCQSRLVWAAMKPAKTAPNRPRIPICIEL